MKKLKEIIDYLFKLSLRHISLMMRLARYLSFQTKISNGYLARKKIRQRIFSKKPFKVLYGPFKGMTYPDSISIGSVWLPKVLGTYESELHDILQEICTKNYSKIINIGAGEGYYAVGLALRFPTARIYAFEADFGGQDICRQIIRANNVSERVSIFGYCDREQLAKLAFDPLEKILIVCDCEGCELELLCPDKLTNLRNFDMLVEWV